MASPPCRFCRRTREDPNPIRVGAYQELVHLPFVRAHEACCIPCKNYSAVAWFAKQKSGQELKKEVPRELFVLVWLVTGPGPSGALETSRNHLS